MFEKSVNGMAWPCSRLASKSSVERFRNASIDGGEAPLWVIHDRPEPAAGPGHVRCAPESN
jgi:hypothetical protein